MTGSKKLQKSTAAVSEERFSFTIGEDDLETFLIRREGVQLTLAKARNGL